MIKKRIPRDAIFDPHPKRKPPLLRRLLFLLLFAISSTAVTSWYVKAETPDSQAGTLTFTGSTVNTEALHLRTHADVSITGLMVDVRYSQRFRNNSEQWVNGVYTFPLPELAAINAMEIRIGERVIKGEIKEKADARKIFQHAISQGQQAALTEQQRPNLFSQQIGNIPPGEEIAVTLHFVDVADYQRGRFSWRLPTTLTPRYMPGSLLPTLNETKRGHQDTQLSQTGWASVTTEVGDAPLITPPMVSKTDGYSNPLSVNIDLLSGQQLSEIAALYHQLDIRKQTDGHRIRLRDGQTEMDRDFILQWTPVASAQPAAALFRQQLGDDTYAMLMVTPPATTLARTLPRDIIFIIDTSGSMQGQSIVQAKASLEFAINQLEVSDRFNIIAFNSRPLSMFAYPQPADPATVRMASGWIASLQADGGTEMAPALSAAFMQARESERLQQIVFITDGAVGNESSLFRLISQQAGNARLFTVGIGSAPNRYFMTKAAEFGRGTFEFIGHPSQVRQRMGNLFQRLDQSVAKNIQISWPEKAEVYPAKTPDLYADQPVLSFARLSALPEKVSVSGETASQPWTQTLNSLPAGETKGIGARWARRKIADIEEKGHTGELDDTSVRTQVLDVALTHSLLSRFTAFVAVDSKIVRPDASQRPLLLLAVPNLQPHGLQLSYPATATRATLMLWIGGLCLLAGLTMLIYQRRTSQDD